MALRPSRLDGALLLGALAAVVILSVGSPVLLVTQCDKLGEHNVDHLKTAVDRNLPAAVAVALALIGLRRFQSGDPDPPK